MLTELQGQIERITYTNEENGSTVARVKVQFKIIYYKSMVPADVHGI